MQSYAKLPIIAGCDDQHKQPSSSNNNKLAHNVSEYLAISSYILDNPIGASLA